MGGFTTIKLKDTSIENIKNANAILDAKKVNKSYRFYSEEDVKEEYEYYKRGDGHYPEHQFPKDKIKSYKDFTKYWSTEALGEVFVPSFGTLTFDCYFGRTKQTTMDKIARFIYDNLELIGEVGGSYSTFIEDKITLPQKKKDVLIKLETPFEPEELSENEKTDDSLQSGQWLCKSWGNEPFWVLYGNVDSPRFMKKKVYVDDLYNDIYKDKQGRGFLLMPLMPLDADEEWFNDLYSDAYNMGLREHPHFIMPLLYNLTVNVISNEVVEQFKEMYTQEELYNRFQQLYVEMESTFGYNKIGGFVFKDDVFEPCGGNITTVMSKCQVLTTLYRAGDLKIKNEGAGIKIL